MIRKIILENFMSHGRTEIELSDGLTVLTGPNNCGKSAVVAALQAVASGGRTTHVMRHGEKVCRVTVETDDDHVVVWERKKTTSKYSINGEDIHRTGQNIPESLHDVLKLDRVSTKVGATEEVHDIHFGQQKSPVFLLDQPGSKAAAFFASSSDASRLIEMQGLHRKRVADQRKEVARVEKELNELNTRISALDPINHVGVKIEAAEIQRSAIEAGSARLEKLRSIIRQIRQASRSKRRFTDTCVALRQIQRATTSPERLQQQTDRCVKLRSGLLAAQAATTARVQGAALCKSLELLRDPPSSTDTRPIRNLIRQLSQTRAKFDLASQVTARCVALTRAPSIRDTDRLRDVRNRLSQLTRTMSNVRATCMATNVLVPLPIVRPTDRIDQVARRIKTATIKWNCMKQAVGMFQELKGPLPPAETQSLQQCIVRLRPVITRRAEAEESVKTASVAVHDHQQRIHDFVRANPKCETCGGDIDPETLMSTLPDSHQHDAKPGDSSASVAMESR